MAVTARLNGISGSAWGKVIQLADAPVTIGRDLGNSIVLQEQNVSRSHCRIERDGDAFILRDLGSHNQTRVNGTAAVEHKLEHGDQIFIGSCVFQFVTTDSASVSSQNTVILPSSEVQLQDLPELKILADAKAQSRLHRSQHDLSTLITIATHISSIHTLDSLQWQLLGMIFDVLPADRGAFLLCSKPGDAFTSVAWNRYEGPAEPVVVSRTLTAQVIRTGKPVVAANVALDEHLRDITSLNSMKVVSVLVVPLLVADAVLGLIYLDTVRPGVTFDDTHVQLLTAIAGICTLALQNVRQIEDLEGENRRLRDELNITHNLLGESPRMIQVYKAIAKVAPTESTVLLQGESGTGKELAARAIHDNSPRAGRPFVAINCAAVTETLLESELFGHEKGSFTGALGQKKGLLETANGGTAFLDEVSELALPLQAKLLRVLQERELMRVGGNTPVRIDVRIVAATNRDLAESAKTGRFRQDLFYRLNVVGINLPPLRERASDAVLLAEHFCRIYSEKCKRHVRGLSKEARKCVAVYGWPGNVRELQNAMERAIVLGSAEWILPEDLPEAVLEAQPSLMGPGLGSGLNYHEELTRIKKELILSAIERAGGSFTEAAKILGVHPNYLHRLIRNLELRPLVTKDKVVPD
jgi:transcriptional regulator with GAF, ATPase, and Fis domain